MIRQVILIAFFSLEIVYAMFGYPNAKPLTSYGLQLKLGEWYVRLGEGATKAIEPVLRDEHYYTVVDRKIYELDNLGFHTILELRGEWENIESVEHYCETHKTEVESCSEVTPISKETALSPVQIIKRQNAGQVAIGKGKDMKFWPLLKFDEFYTAVGQTIYKLKDLGARRKVLTPAKQQESLSNYLASHNMLTEETPKDDPKKRENGAPSSSHNAIPSEDIDANKIEANKKASSTHYSVQ
ncbi:hypothetical protein DdX_14714 [Ditylenchus destructor]|uniref:Uncharacterized protein n=1 Tax=Ditylenchus destructor TaxID=166010 RepID=A0AAD4R1P4_9BILA|nr:hypothetical protein DdX_14714 [Ditylenchus destructor]